MSSSFRQPLIVIACGILLWAITAQINHYLAVWHMNVFTGGLMVAYPALRLHQRDMWRVVLPLGLWIDAASAAPFGMHMFLFLFACALIHHFRVRIPRADTILGIVVAIVVNIGVVAAVSIAFAMRGPVPPGTGVTLIMDIVLSSVLIALIGPWFFALQTRALTLAGIDLHTQLSQK